MTAFTAPKDLCNRWALEEMAFCEFERMKENGSSDRLALECAIRAFERAGEGVNYRREHSSVSQSPTEDADHD